ncbi:Zn(II)2Cys6 transcription factor [Aspergillus undulatus]|uniref:Zn(II)2Cys6 transcription factor n=1 Tax=Aspergillus undulatus TaxID=1810928 RepID=UPI003CCE3CEC
MPLKRKKTPHVKSGCRTCKIRRVKCDEQRPSCAKCISSGRKCDGYGIWSTPPVRPPTQQLAYPPRTLPSFSPVEKQYLDRYRNLLTAKLAQPFGSYFWSSMVLQLSLSETAVLHAAIALTFTHELFMQRRSFNEPFLLQQYNRAIKALTSSTVSLRVAIVSCVLFLCIEILRGDPNAMQIHFDSGTRLLRQLQRGNRDCLVLVKHNPEAFDDHLVDVFAKLNLQFLMLGHASQQKEAFVPSFHYKDHLQLLPRFPSVREVQQSINPVLLSVIYLMKEREQQTLYTDRHPPRPSAAQLQKQKVLQCALSDWVASYERSITALCTSISWTERFGLLLLRVYADVSTILLATCFSIKETAYDCHLSLFDSIVNRYQTFHEDEYLPEANNCPAHPFFTTDTCLFPPLYFTALKCRNQGIRQKAISLLEEYHHLEGPWTGPMVAAVAKHVVSLEEKDFKEALQSSTDQSDPGTGIVLPEFCRIHCVECKPDGDSKTSALTLRRFRHELGEAGGWAIIKSTIALTPE